MREAEWWSLIIKVRVRVEERRELGGNPISGSAVLQGHGVSVSPLTQGHTLASLAVRTRVLAPHHLHWDPDFAIYQLDGILSLSVPQFPLPQKHP